MNVIQIPAWPGNFRISRAGLAVLWIVNHMAFDNYAGTVAWFRNPVAGVSSTYVLGKDGTVAQMVSEQDTPYTNGNIRMPNLAAVPALKGYIGNPNMQSITIEWEGAHTGGSWHSKTWQGHTEKVWEQGSDGVYWQPTEVQYQAGLELHRQIIAANKIPIDRGCIVRHSDFDTVFRAYCPGGGFPLARLLGDLGDPEFVEFATPTPTSVPPTAGVYLFGPPSISLDLFTKLLKTYHSPVGAGTIPYSDYYKAITDAGIDPATALAMFVHESQAGTDGVAQYTKNWGNLRPKQDGSIGRAVDTYKGFRRYDTWYDSLLDYLDTLNTVYKGMSLPEVLSSYAPSSENTPAVYVQKVEHLVYNWRQSKAAQ